ncbi:MAG: replicative DNA helicase [Gammaproteobacteria bacterium RIFCSPLOWO2_02_FULL_42_14]|nr:MAG: replicative DNA helicase [Gammaproteobacteria bacterium RIFCSPHIGHO2_02_FULL_42_43]OGT52936.1 MAG: replicative DNA helicase [Gammaproteobacteria bacterium RIFCSPHIGHO2_12_FULL_41_25]OGT61290.1 MAG: replicative DNA helicase [Gammaproteobacteria bacterium RIFCSPLOWO2_02_FULL_42_14]OGT87219.1 MAG: replicative DNA helicase [Gammaproteobacteria bacterium RIFCSPLOWO2_12_FULL_42_18]
MTLTAERPSIHTKVPPHSIEAEQSVLGALMLDHRTWDQIADRITPADFYRGDHRAIFETVLQLIQRSQPFDALTIAESLKHDNKISMLPGGEAYLYELAQNTPSAANITAYADIVRERSILRQLISVGTDVTDSVFHPDGRDSQALLDNAERLVYRIAENQQRGSGPVPIAELLSQATDRLDLLAQTKGALTGVPTGFSDFDQLTSGLQAGDMIVIAGRPSMGKTSLAMNIAEFAAIKQEKPVLVFSLEMPAAQLALRMISSLGRIDQHKVRTGQLSDDDWPRVSSAVSVLSESRLFVDDTPALSPLELRTRARRLARKHNGLSLIVIDYLQLMTSPSVRENRTNEISEISRALKSIAKEFNVPVIALSQLNRGLEQRTDKRPVMSDLRESGAIEQDADVIAFIYRDEVYHEDSPHKGTAEIIIRKQRNGPIGDFRVTFLGKYTRFENFSANRSDADDHLV